MSSVVRPWLADCCSFKMQAVLLSALRGCDGLPKEDISKQITRKYRSVLFFPAEKEIAKRTFMNTDGATPEIIQQFCSHLDHYPMHWLMHFTHAIEIVGYKHPDIDIRNWWGRLYSNICCGLHVRPETVEECNYRLRDNLE